ncbi:hypothetical protein AB0N81_12565 [Streptomyces sp. NPDC093510]|uniref:hypothetical protein n=1 Tax=Streptomyces sp. NPDC093510 TaxID=3155199 RepID=UPI00341528AF
MRREVVGAIVAIGVLGVPAVGAARADTVPGGGVTVAASRETSQTVGPEDDGWG